MYNKVFNILLIADFIFLIVYPQWLKRNEGFSAGSFLGALLGALDAFLFALFFYLIQQIFITGASKVVFVAIGTLVIPLLRYLILTNYKILGSRLHTFLMTLWQLTGGVIILTVILMPNIGSGKRRK